MNISELFLNAAKQYPDHLAIVEGNKKINFADLRKEVIATAAYFSAQGIKKGDRVLVFVPMSIDLYRIVLALFYNGSTAVFLDEWVSKERLELCCRLADCKGFVGVRKARIFAWFSKELRAVPTKLKLRKTIQKPHPITEVDEDTAALITFTTGSTGTPKAARRTHTFLKEQFDALLDEINPKPEDIDMPVLPIILFINLGVGCTSIIADFKMTKPEAMKKSKIIKQIQQHKVNRIIASPFFVKKLAEHVFANPVKLPHLKNIFTGGAPVFPKEAALYHSAFTNTQSFILYGSTEAEPMSGISAAELAQRQDDLIHGLPVGKRYHKADIRVIKIFDDTIIPKDTASWNALQLPNGDIGEIVVAGPHVLKQYFNNEEALKRNKVNVDGELWHRTGDSGFIKDEELFLTGRCQQLITTSNGYLSPFIIENRMLEIPEVDLGTIMELNGEIVLVVTTSLSEEELGAYFKDIPFTKIIKTPEIPRDPRHNSKIDYPKLKQQLLG